MKSSSQVKTEQDRESKYLSASLDHSIGALWAAATPTVALVDRRANWNSQFAVLRVGGLRARHGTTA